MEVQSLLVVSFPILGKSNLPILSPSRLLSLSTQYVVYTLVWRTAWRHVSNTKYVSVTVRWRNRKQSTCQQQPHYHRYITPWNTVNEHVDATFHHVSTSAERCHFWVWSAKDQTKVVFKLQQLSFLIKLQRTDGTNISNTIIWHKVDLQRFGPVLYVS